MGRTGSLREYLSSVSTTIANTSGGGDKDKISPSELFKRTYNYLINFSNLEAITVVDVNNVIQTSSITSEDVTQFVPITIDSHLQQVALQYKNKWSLLINVSEPLHNEQYTVPGTGGIMATDNTNNISYAIEILACSSDNPNVDIEYCLSFGSQPGDVTTFVVAQELVEH